MWISRAVIANEIHITGKQPSGLLGKTPAKKVRFTVGDSRRPRSAVHFFNLLQKSWLMFSKA